MRQRSCPVPRRPSKTTSMNAAVRRTCLPLWSPNPVGISPRRRRKSLIGYYGEQEGGYLWNRLKVHYTPKHGSWLNQAEIELSLYSRIADLAKLKQETKTWNGRANQKRTKINWRFTRKKARKLFKYDEKHDSSG